MTSKAAAGGSKAVRATTRATLPMTARRPAMPAAKAARASLRMPRFGGASALVERTGAGVALDAHESGSESVHHRRASPHA
jgi:hypothetical protein